LTVTYNYFLGLEAFEFDYVYLKEKADAQNCSWQNWTEQKLQILEIQLWKQSAICVNLNICERYS